MKYYYDCPIQAAWMYANHQLQFDNMQLLIFCDGAKIIINELSPYQPQRIYVSEDSLPILDPQVGDVLYNTRYGYASMISEQSKDKNGKYAIFNLDNVIINRVGHAFHYPKTENTQPQNEE